MKYFVYVISLLLKKQAFFSAARKLFGITYFSKATDASFSLTLLPIFCYS